MTISCLGPSADSKQATCVLARQTFDCAPFAHLLVQAFENPASQLLTSRLV